MINTYPYSAAQNCHSGGNNKNKNKQKLNKQTKRKHNTLDQEVKENKESGEIITSFTSTEFAQITLCPLQDAAPGSFWIAPLLRGNFCALELFMHSI